MSQKESKKRKIGKIQLDDYHYHELLDRLYVVMSTIDDHLIQLHKMRFAEKTLELEKIEQKIESEKREATESELMKIGLLKRDIAESKLMFEDSE